jgi:hypothetical protein
MELKVIGARGFETRRGIYWTGVLVANGVKVLRFENAGDGGCCTFDWCPGFDRKPVEKALCALVPDVKFEPLDAALGQLWDEAMMASEAA